MDRQPAADTTRTTPRSGASATPGSRWVGPVVAALCLALVAFSVLHSGAGAARDPELARQVIATPR